MRIYARSWVGDKCGVQIMGPTMGQAQNFLPTKTSSFVIHLSGRLPSFFKIASQAACVSLMCVIFLFIVVAVILSLMSLLFIVLSHRFLISGSECSLSWMTCSHCSTQVR